MAEARRNRRDESLSVKGLLRLQRFGGMYGLERIRRILKHLPNGRKGGTVVPPCDFQTGVSESTVNKGIPP